MSDEQLELEEARVVHLHDADTDSTLETEVFIEIELDDKVYALLTPTKPVITVMRATEGDDDEDGELEELELEEFAALREHFVKALAPFGVTIVEEGGELLLEGETDEEFYEDCEVLDVETDNGDDELLVLVRVETGAEVFLVATPSVPAMYPVELVGDDARLLSQEELEQMHDIFTDALHGSGILDEEG